MPGKWWGGGLLILLASSVGLAQIHVTPPVTPLLPHAACALMVSGECALKALHRSFDVIQEAGEPVVVMADGKVGAGASESLRLKVKEDLDASRLNGEITPEEAMSVAADLARLEGIGYHLPEIEKLKADLGFNKDSEIDKDDLRELVRTHLQLTFGMQPATAKYFTERMGLENPDSFEVRVALGVKNLWQN